MVNLILILGASLILILGASLILRLEGAKEQRNPFLAMTNL